MAINGVKTTNTIAFISRDDVPAGQPVTYATFVLDYRSLKSEPYRNQITVGGDKLEYLADTGLLAANMMETTILLNSVISDAHQGARILSANIKDHFLHTLTDTPEYMRVPYSCFPPNIKDYYQLQNIVTSDGYIFIKINKAMYGLKQAAILAYQCIKKSLVPHVYYPVVGTTGLWRYNKKKIFLFMCG